MRNTTKAGTGILAVLAVLVIMAAPASANTVGASITSGSITLYGPFNHNPEATIALGGSGSCSSSNSVTATQTSPGAGTIVATINSVSDVPNPFPGSGPDFISDLTTTLSGTYSGTTINFNNQSATAVLQKSSGSCTPDTLQGTCTISASGLDLTGSLTKGTFPTLVTGDTASLSGQNTDFETGVSDTGTACGGFTAVNNGHVEIDVVIEVD